MGNTIDSDLNQQVEQLNERIKHLENKLVKFNL